MTTPGSANLARQSFPTLVEHHDDGPRLDWASSDPEGWFGLTGERFTRVSVLLPLLLALGTTVLFYAALLPLKDGSAARFAEMFTQRGPVQYAIVFASLWCLFTLLFKAKKVGVQRMALGIRVVPADPTVALAPETASEVMANMRFRCDDPRRFVLLNRVDIALCNLQNMGQISDFEGVLRAQADADEDVMEGGYSLLRGVLWAIPVLGFIGTVQGLSGAIGGFGSVLSETTDISTLRPALQEVAGGLATAFETTLVALVAALCLQLLVTIVHRADQQLLDDCREYCQRELVSRLRFRSAASSPSAGPSASTEHASAMGGR